MLKKKIIAQLLFIANSDVPFTFKDKFYNLKERLLKEHGHVIGYVAQHIQKECWTCNGTGKYGDFWWQKEKCWNCNGTGYYKNHTNLLAEYKIHNKRFLVPFMTVPGYWSYSIDKTIHGYIERRKLKNDASYEAALWLFLIFDYKSFKEVYIPVPILREAKYPLLWIVKQFSKFKVFSKKQDLPF